MSSTVTKEIGPKEDIYTEHNEYKPGVGSEESDCTEEITRKRPIDLNKQRGWYEKINYTESAHYEPKKHVHRNQITLYLPNSNKNVRFGKKHLTLNTPNLNQRDSFERSHFLLNVPNLNRRDMSESTVDSEIIQALH